MNARAEILSELRAKRELLEHEAEIWRQRARVEELVRAAEKAEHALETARPASQSAIENYFSQGATGPMPGIDSMRQAELQERAITARHAADAAKLQLKAS